MPYYDLKIPHGYVETILIEVGECTELANYVSIATEKNPENDAQTYQTLSFDLSGIYEFEKLSCSTT